MRVGSNITTSEMRLRGVRQVSSVQGVYHMYHTSHTASDPQNWHRDSTEIQGHMPTNRRHTQTGHRHMSTALLRTRGADQMPARNRAAKHWGCQHMLRRRIPGQEGGVFRGHEKGT